MHNLLIQVQYGGELTTIEGTLFIKGKIHHVSYEISADERTAVATVDGQEFWWCGSEQNDANPIIERELERVLEDAFQLACKKGIDLGADWFASVTRSIRVSQSNYESEKATN